MLEQQSLGNRALRLHWTPVHQVTPFRDRRKGNEYCAPFLLSRPPQMVEHQDPVATTTAVTLVVLPLLMQAV